MRAVKPEATAAATSTKPQCESTFIAAAAASTAVTTNPEATRDGDPFELRVGGASVFVSLIHLFFDLFWPEDDDRVSEIFSISEQEAAYANSAGDGMSFLDVTEEYLVFFESALNAGEEVAGGFKFMNGILMLHTMVQGLAKRSGRDPRDIYSRTCYRLIARIGDELGDEAFRLD